MKQDKIIITGASGLLGANLVQCLNQLGQNVIALCNRHLVEFENILTLQINLDNYAQVEKFLENHLPSVIIHCAAATNVDWCEKNPDAAFNLNSSTSGYLANITKQINAKLVYISTDSVFDGQRGNYSESDTPAPVNIYAQSKLAGEQEILAASSSNLVVRTNMYGWNIQSKLSLSEWVLTELKNNHIINGFCDAIFNPLLVNDLSYILYHMIEKNLKGIYHVGSQDICSKYEFALSIADILNIGAEHVQKAYLQESDLYAPRPLNTSLDTTKISSQMSGKLPNIHDGLEKFVKLRDTGYVHRLKNCLYK